MNIHINGIIGIDYTPSMLKEDLKSKTGDISVSIASPGGYIDDGLEIHNLIRDYPGKTTAILNGTVASAAAYITTAFNEVKAKDNAIYMIHNAFAGLYGDANDFESEARELRKLNNHLAKSFAKKSGKTTNQILLDMDKTTWLYGDEIKDYGFADEMITSGIESDKQTALLDSKAAFGNMRSNLKPKVDEIKKVALFIENNSQEDPEQLIDEQGVKKVTKQELLKEVNVLKENNGITLREIANSMGLDDLLISDDQRSNLDKFNSILSLSGDESPVDFVNSLIKKNNENSDKIREAAILEIAGREEVNGKENILRTHAESYFENRDINDETIKSFKENAITKRLAGEMIDPNSDFNKAGIGENNKSVIPATRVDKV